MGKHMISDANIISKCGQTRDMWFLVSNIFKREKSCIYPLTLNSVS
jgi:hypothetical protein